ncbi:MAG TPA: hypothetical protein VLB44_09550 [Kofleriaceae bacterium]|nr:hypothetical protein [Kofleriaceae bacterium]
MSLSSTASLVGILLALAACDTKGGGGGANAPKAAESGTKKGSAGGFSATLSAELGKQHVEPASIAATAPPAGSGAKPAAGSAAAGSATTAVAMAPATGSAAAPGKPDKSTPAISTAGNTAVASAPAAATKTGSAAPAATPPNQLAQPPGTGKGETPQNLNRTPMKPSAELAAIKFDLEPNWDRDLGEAATFSLVVKIPNTNETRVFMVHYGYEDQAAPVDCDSYRKYLEDKKVMTVTLNRQRGAACYIEGDAGKGPVFRYVLTYGGKHLLCSGSLYKDQAALGDLRDKVLMQAKKICETLAL